MSLFGAMQSGISGMTAQSTSMGAISDNISNVNTIGYKNTNVAFQTLVTKQASTNYYSPGGVQPVSKQSINAQGLLGANSSSTALGISGKGYFVVNTSANPGLGDTWAYTRAGDFDADQNGYLKNTAGFYLQGWSLMPWDGNSNASIVNINGINYMKAYAGANGETVYINDNIVDSRNMQPINLGSIGGTASPTQQISFGANLPANAPIFDPAVPSAGGRYSVNALIYDSLGNASNLSFDFTKETSNSWGMATTIPPGAASITLSSGRETFGDASKDIYYSAGQLEFTRVPDEGSSITIEDEGKAPNGISQKFTYVFTSDPSSVTEPNTFAVDISTGVVSASDFAQRFIKVLQDTMPDANRFSVSSNSIQIVQSLTGNSLAIDASKTLACVQSAVNPKPETGIPTGQFRIEQIDHDLKNVGSLTFVDTDPNNYLGKTFTFGDKTYEFVNGSTAAAGNIAIDLANAMVNGDFSVSKLAGVVAEQIRTNGGLIEPERVSFSGSTVTFTPTTTGPDMTFNFGSLTGLAYGETRFGDAWVSTTGGEITLKNEFSFNNTDIEQGALIPAVRFNTDGTPKYINVDEMQIEWANGAENMNGDYKQGTPISIQMGTADANDGLTSLSGNFDTNYVRQDGAKFGSYSGVQVDEQGVVTALFDNGETRPIAILPLATFANPNGMTALTGNVWIETDNSGQVLLKQAGTNGAGQISGNSLEQSTVDLATEFSNMIITQRAYSAATKIITTADEMLEELTRLT